MGPALDVKFHSCITRFDQSVHRLLVDSDEGVQEQAFNVVRNIAEDEESIDLIFEELGSDVLLNRVAHALSSSDDYVVLQVTFLLRLALTEDLSGCLCAR